MADFIKVNSVDSLGEISINKSVLEDISKIVIEEIAGVHLVNSTLKKGISCQVSKEGLIKIECEIRLNYGLNAERTSRHIQEKVHNEIKQQCDLNCDQVDVHVVGFNFKNN